MTYVAAYLSTEKIQHASDGNGWKERTRCPPIFMYTDPLISTTLIYTRTSWHRVREIREKRCLISVRLINDTLVWNIFSVFFPSLSQTKMQFKFICCAWHWYTRLRSLREHIASNFSRGWLTKRNSKHTPTPFGRNEIFCHRFFLVVSLWKE